MKAAVYYGPGDVRIEDVREPGEPGAGMVMLRVEMGGLCGTDASQWRAATMVPLTRPHPASRHVGPVILGHEVVGTVVATGAGVTHLVKGMRVVPGAGMWCGECSACLAGRPNICERYFLYGIHAHGGLAEYALFPAKMCVPVPEGCTLEAAAMAQPCAVALHALSRGQIRPEHTVALFGAGGIGSLLLAVMQANTEGTQRVYIVDVNPARLDTALQLGAAGVIDAAHVDPVATILDWSGGYGVDLAIDATGVATNEALATVCRGGRLLAVGIPHHPMTLDVAEAVTREKEMITTNGMICSFDLPHALHLLATTNLAERVGYEVIALDDLVPHGLVPLAEGRAAGKILVCVCAGKPHERTY